MVLLEARKDLSPLVAALPSYSEDLEPHYELTLYATARVAKRATQMLSIKPRDEFRYGYMLWLDKATAMPLKSQLTDEKGEIVEQNLFTGIEMLESIPLDALDPTIDTTGFEWLRPPESTQLTSEVRPEVPWRASSLPGGFKLSVATQSAIAGSETPVEHLVYSDGLATVSVFIEDPNTKAEVRRGFLERRQHECVLADFAWPQGYRGRRGPAAHGSHDRLIPGRRVAEAAPSALTTA